jgi:hypothetical protein
MECSGISSVHSNCMQMQCTPSSSIWGCDSLQSMHVCLLPGQGSISLQPCCALRVQVALAAVKCQETHLLTSRLLDYVSRHP